MGVVPNGQTAAISCFDDRILVYMGPFANLHGAPLTALVLGDSLLQLVGATCVVGVIGAAENVCKERSQHCVY